MWKNVVDKSTLKPGDYVRYRDGNDEWFGDQENFWVANRVRIIDADGVSARNATGRRYTGAYVRWDQFQVWIPEPGRPTPSGNPAPTSDPTPKGKPAPKGPVHRGYLWGGVIYEPGLIAGDAVETVRSRIVEKANELKELRKRLARYRACEKKWR